MFLLLLTESKGKRRGHKRKQNSGDWENGIEFGVNFVGDVGDGINLQAGVTGSLLPAAPAAPPGTDDNFSFLIGAKATVENLTFGGGFVTFGDASNNDIGFNAGVQYTQGAFVFGANMSFVQAENINRNSTITFSSADSTTAPGAIVVAAQGAQLSNILTNDPNPGIAVDRINELIFPANATNLPADYIIGSDISSNDRMEILNANTPLERVTAAVDAITRTGISEFVGNPSLNYVEGTDVDYLVIAAGATYHIAPGLKAMVDAVFHDDDGDGERGNGSGFVVLGGFQIAF